MSRLLVPFLIALVLSTPADAYSRKRWSGAVILWNYTDVPIPYQVCTDGESPCEPHHLCEGVLEPGGWEYHGRTREAGFNPLHLESDHRRDLHFSVRFDGSFEPGVQHAIVHLPHNTVEADRTKPIQARAYAFVRVGNEIRLVKGDHPAVAAIGRPQFTKWAREWTPPPPPSYRQWLWKPTGTVAGTPGSTMDSGLGRPTMPRPRADPPAIPSTSPTNP